MTDYNEELSKLFCDMLKGMQKSLLRQTTDASLALMSSRRRLRRISEAMDDDRADKLIELARGQIKSLKETDEFWKDNAIYFNTENEEMIAKLLEWYQDFVDILLAAKLTRGSNG